MGRGMRIVGVAMVKNEEDIVECFVRYHLSFLDGLVVLDNGSSDGTARILASLRREGLPVYLRYDPQVSYRQAQMTTALVRDAAEEFGADYIVVLDADEFLRAREGGRDVRLSLERALKGVELAYVRWTTYVPDVQSEIGASDGSQVDVLRRVQMRRRSEATAVYKVIVSRASCQQPDFELRQGNHDIVRHDCEKTSARTVIEDLVLAHFPVRNHEQAERKYLIGWLGNLAREQPALFDWALYFQRFKNGEVARKDVPRLAYFYNCADRTGDLDLVLDPVPVPSGVVSVYGGGKATDTLRALLSHCERLARCVGGTELSQGVGWTPEMVSTLFDCTLGPAALSLGEAAALFRWIAPDASEDNVVVAETSYVGGLSDALRTLADARHFEMRLVRLSGAHAHGIHGGVGQVDRLVVHGVASAAKLRDDYCAGLAVLRPGGGLVLFDVLDTRDQEVRNLADTQVAGSDLWTDERLYERFLFATRAGRPMRDRKLRNGARECAE